MYQDKQLRLYFLAVGQAAEASGRLAMATVLQFMEGLSDRQTVDSVRARIDWKYALGLELTDCGFDHTVLSEFRTRLVEGKLELLSHDVLLERAQTLGLLKKRGNQRTDSTHVLAARGAHHEPVGAHGQNVAIGAEQHCCRSSGVAEGGCRSGMV